MDQELEILVDAVSRGAIKNDRASLKIIHDALKSNIGEAKELHAKLTAARGQCHEWLEKVQQMVAEQDRSMDNLITIIALNTANLREIDSMMADLNLKDEE